MSAETEHAPINNDNGMPVAATEVKAERPGHRVYIGNLSFSTTEEQVRELLAPAGGEIIDLVLPNRGPRPGGFAIAGYKEEEQANKAIEVLAGKELDDRKLRIQRARSEEETAAKRKANKERREAAKATRKLQEREEDLATADAIIEGAKEGEDGAVKPKKKKAARGPKNRRRGPGEEEDGEEGGAEAAETPAADGEGESKPKPKRKPKSKKPQEARIDGAAEEPTEGAEAKEKKPKERKPRQPRMQLTDEQSKTSIFVSNLPFSLDDDALAAIFTNLSIGVKSAKVVTGLRRARGGKPFRASRGFGFVEVENASQQQEAVDKVQGSLIGDRQIAAKIANEMKPIEAEAVEAQAEATVG